MILMFLLFTPKNFEYIGLFIVNIIIIIIIIILIMVIVIIIISSQQLTWMNTTLDPDHVMLPQVYPYVIHLTYLPNTTADYTNFLNRMKDALTFPPFNSTLFSANQVCKYTGINLTCFLTFVLNYYNSSLGLI